MKIREIAGRFKVQIFCILLIACVWPWRYLASPKWEIWVVGSDGNAIPGLSARLAYQNYSTEGEGHEITLKTDENGHAIFPPQYERASLLQWAFFTARSATGGVHASFGRSAFVFVFGNGYEGDAVSGKYVVDWSGRPDFMKSRIVAARSEMVPR